MILTLLALVAQTAPAIETNRTADGRYQLTVAPFAEARLDEVNEAVAAKAAATCGAQSVRWGSMRYTGQVNAGGARPSGIGGYVRDFECVADVSAFAPAPADWKPSSRDEADARRATEQFYAAIDAGAPDRAAAMYESGAIRSDASWLTDLRTMTAQIGKGTRRITGSRWVPNPRGAPHPGVYVRLTFVGSFPGAPVYCGSINFYRQGPGEYRVVGDQEHYLSASDRPDARRIAEYRANYCE
jgi:hypothetical protein